MSGSTLSERIRAQGAVATRPGQMAALEGLAHEVGRIERGAAELGKSLVYWMELAKEATHSGDLIGADGDGDWGGVAERLTDLAAENAELRAALEAAEIQAAHLKDADTYLVKARRDHRDLTSRLGFGDDITEPMADNDTIVAWFADQGSDASEWREHERWRDDCYAAGHPADEDCFEHDPHLREQRLHDGVTSLLTDLAKAEPQHFSIGLMCVRLRALLNPTESVVTPGGNPICPKCGNWYGPGKHDCPTERTET